MISLPFRYNTRSRPSSGQRAVHEAACHESCCYLLQYHLRRLRQIRRSVGSEVTTQLVLALIIWRLDYCNTALAGLPQTMIAPLQRVQNAVACLVFELGSREDVTPCLLQLHWLPVCWRIQFKLCCIMHSVFNGNCLRHYSGSECQQTTSSSMIILIDQLRATTTSHQVWLTLVRIIFGCDNQFWTKNLGFAFSTPKTLV